VKISEQSKENIPSTIVIAYYQGINSTSFIYIIILRFLLQNELYELVPGKKSMSSEKIVE
jgi:hypothetical protein